MPTQTQMHAQAGSFSRIYSDGRETIPELFELHHILEPLVAKCPRDLMQLCMHSLDINHSISILAHTHDVNACAITTPLNARAIVIVRRKVLNIAEKQHSRACAVRWYEGMYYRVYW